MNGGETVVSANQRVNGGQWVYLGVYAMTPGVGQQVVLRDDAAGVTAADAVRFVPTLPVPGS